MSDGATRSAGAGGTPGRGALSVLSNVAAPDAATDIYADTAAWAAFNAESDPAAFAREWLVLQCRLIGGVDRAVLLLGAADAGPYAPAAQWSVRDAGGLPGEWSFAGRPVDGSALQSVAELALAERQGVVQPAIGEAPDGPAGEHLAYPLVFGRRLYGAVALALSNRSEASLERVMRQLQWGSAWLQVLVDRQAGDRRDLITVLELVAACFRHDRFKGAATALVTELATRLDCERVSLGFLCGRRIELEALSHSADFGKKSNLTQALQAAMEEALDQQTTLTFPPVGHGDPDVTRAHARLAQQFEATGVCSVPFGDGRQLRGALTFERGAGGDERGAGETFDPATVELCEHAARLVGPIIELRRREDRWPHQKLAGSVGNGLGALLGPRHLGLKLSVVLLAAVTTFFAVATGEHRVTADATLEGLEQRAIVAPIDGYVEEAHARAGDLVKQGTLVAGLDQRDLVLERLKWESEREQRQRAYRDAIARHERSEVMILEAQIAQAEVELAAIEEQLARTRLLAPIDGIVVSGDLSQSLDAPVARGDILFEIAPLAQYRVVLSVDERDVALLQTGQRGRLALAGIPGETYPIVVEKVTPVAQTMEGHNVFRVEAALDADGPATLETLRPGMEGVGKVDIGERKLAWIWGHRVTEWMRMTWWYWFP